MQTAARKRLRVVVVDACPEPSDRNTLAVMCIALTGINHLFVVFRSRRLPVETPAALGRALSNHN